MMVNKSLNRIVKHVLKHSINTGDIMTRKEKAIRQQMKEHNHRLHVNQQELMRACGKHV